MSDVQGLRIVVSADVQNALRNMTDLTDATAELATEGVGNLTTVSLALADLKKAQAEAGDPAQLQVLNRAIQDLSGEAQRLRNIGVAGFDDLGNRIRSIGPATQEANAGMGNLLGSVSRNRVAFLDLGRIVTGEGFSLRSVAANFTLFNPLVVVAAAAIGLLAYQFLKQSDAEKKAAEDAKKLKEFLLDLKTVGDITESQTGSESGNIARVQALAAAIQDSNKSYKERNNALLELRETNKNYFGDLTLEAASLKTLSDRVKDYSQALITEAIVKGQVEEIANVSREYQKQVVTLKTLTDQRDKYQAGLAKVVVADEKNEDFNSTAVIEYEAEIARATRAVDDQKKVTDTLKASIDSYTSSLQENIAQQIKQKPLHIDPKDVDRLEKEIQNLEKAKSALDALTKGQLPTFAIQQQLDEVNTKLLTDKIALALRDGVKNGLSTQVVALQVSALQQELDKIGVAKKAVIQGTVDVRPEELDEIETKIEKAIGTKGLKVSVPADIKLAIENGNYSKEDQQLLLKKAEEDAIRGLPTIRWTPAIQVIVNQRIISEGLAKQLTAGLNAAFATVAKTGFENFGDSLGKALATGKNPIEAAGKSILGSLGQLIEDIGKNLIQYGIVKEGLDTILSGGIAIPGIAAIALGVGAEIIGSLVKNVGNSYKAFAEGGIVTGPTYGLVGEAGPEVIFPLDRLNSFVKNNSQGNAGQTVKVVGKISGRNINLVQARDNKNQALV